MGSCWWDSRRSSDMVGCPSRHWDNKENEIDSTAPGAIYVGRRSPTLMMMVLLLGWAAIGDGRGRESYKKPKGTPICPDFTFERATG